MRKTSFQKAKLSVFVVGMLATVFLSTIDAYAYQVDTKYCRRLCEDDCFDRMEGDNNWLPYTNLLLASCVASCTAVCKATGEFGTDIYEPQNPFDENSENALKAAENSP